MRAILLVLLPAVVVAGGCRPLDEQLPTESAPAAVEAQQEAVAEAPSLNVAEDAGFCGAYARQLAATRASHARAPGNAALRDEVAAYEAIIADACG
jgi:hypothetical protein